MKVLITTSSFDIAGNPAVQFLMQKGIEIEQNPYGRKLTEDEAAALMNDEVIGMIAGVEPLTRRVLQQATGMIVLSRCGTGMDSVDQQAADDQKIVVLNTPDAPTAAVAELTIGLMLAVLRKIALSDRAMRDGTWNSATGALLGARTVGIIGYGRIGRRVSELLLAFGASVIASDLHETQAGEGVQIVPLEDLVEQSELITLHLPYSSDTHHLVDGPFLSRMKSGSVLINASRGGLIDEGALAQSLTTGHIAGAGIDTFESEPYSGPLNDFEQVVLTAHMGSRAHETRAAMEREAAENLATALANAGVIEGTTDL